MSYSSSPRAFHLDVGTLFMFMKVIIQWIKHSVSHILLSFPKSKWKKQICFVVVLIAINLKKQELLIYDGTYLKKLKHYGNICLLITKKASKSV